MKKKSLVTLLVLVFSFANMISAAAFSPKGVEVVSINDVPGIAIGHWTDAPNQTGTTVIACTETGGATGGVSVLGGSPGTRETDLLEPEKTVQTVNAVVLSGGSAFGLDSATGVMKFMEEKNLGVPVGVTVVPIVPAAVIFDLGRGDDGKLGSGEHRPGADAGYQAAANAFAGVEWSDGNIGAGMGARAGGMKGGLGSYCYKFGDLYVGAIVSVNAAGQVVDPETGDIIAGRIDAETNTFIDREEAIVEGKVPPTSGNTNTTIGCIVTNAKLTQAEANKLAEMAHDGFARAIEPTHTPSDGDCIFAMATGKATTTGTTWGQTSADMSLLGVLAVNAMERAIVSAAYNAETVTDCHGRTTAGAATLRANGATPAQPGTTPAVSEVKPSTPGTSTPASVQYTVVKGDTLSLIGAKYGVSWKAIAELNKLSNPNFIRVGQVLLIPQK